MPIQFNCRCGKLLQARDEHAGRLTRCPSCGTEMTIPGQPAAVQAVPVAPAPERPARRQDDDEAIAREPRRARPADDDGPPYDDVKPPAREPAGTSKAAVAALIFGLVSFCTWFLGGLPAIILGIMGLSAIKRSGGRLGGQGMAVAGLVMGISSMVLWTCLGAPIGLMVPAVQKTREAAGRIQSSNNLKQLSLAMINYADMHQGRLPPAVVYDKDGKPLYSWRVLILPYVEEDFRYKQFRLDEPWDSPNNKALLTPMPRVFALPGREEEAAKGLTHYQVLDGPGAVFHSDLRATGREPFPLGMGKMGLQSQRKVVYPANFPDGMSNTFLIVEAADPIEWSRPGDLKYDPNGPLPRFSNRWSGGFQASLADGSVRFIPTKTAEPTLRAFITPAGGEPIPPDAP